LKFLETFAFFITLPGPVDYSDCSRLTGYRHCPRRWHDRSTMSFVTNSTIGEGRCGDATFYNFGQMALEYSFEIWVI